MDGTPLCSFVANIVVVAVDVQLALMHACAAAAAVVNVCDPIKADASMLYMRRWAEVKVVRPSWFVNFCTTKSVAFKATVPPFRGCSRSGQHQLAGDGLAVQVSLLSHPMCFLLISCPIQGEKLHAMDHSRPLRAPK